MPPLRLPLLLTCSVFQLLLTACRADEAFVPLMDGTTFNGWKVSRENPKSWKVEAGAFVTRGPRSHLFYDGPEQPFKNFELMVEVMTEPGSNGGIYFHTQYQESGWPRAGFETQVNVTHRDAIKSGSLYGIANTSLQNNADGKWWVQHITVEDDTVTVKIDGVIVIRYVEPAGAQPGRRFERKLGSGTFALQAHDRNSVVRYRNLRVRRLPD